MKNENPFHGSFIHEDQELWFGSIDELQEIFSKYFHKLHKVCILAEQVRVLLDDISYDIEKMTSVVCPACENICCINRHSYPEHEDLVYLFALGENPPEYKPELDDRAPCRFLSSTGCTLKRSVRPFRCTWYFCPSLLQYMKDNTGSAMRRYSRKAQNLIDARRQMLDEFIWFINCQGISF
jgi:hypothetical protein